MALTAALGIVFGGEAAIAAPQSTIARVSVGPAGVEANGGSGGSSISADGRYVAFESDATNLVPVDQNGATDIFVRDRQAGTTTLASLGPGGVQANGSSWMPSISADGRFVAFASEAGNLVPVDLNTVPDVFVRDTQLGTTRLISQGSSGLGGGNSWSWAPRITPDGRFVAFYCAANDLSLPIADGNNHWDTFLHDRQTGQTILASLDSAGFQGDEDSAEDPFIPGPPALSSDGRYVVFVSKARNLVPGDTNNSEDVFVRDTLLGTTERVSTDSGGVQGFDYSRAPSISADGRTVAFGSNAGNLVPGDTNNKYDTFVKDRQTGQTERVDVSSSGAQGSGPGFGLVPLSGTSISADGRYVAFGSQFTTLVAGDTNGFFDVFVRDRWAGQTMRVSVDSGSGQSNGVSNYPSISADGLTIAFYSEASNLVAADLNGAPDVFVREPVLPYVALCFPGYDALACPCGNPPSAVGRGCDNSAGTGGAVLVASGLASLAADTVVLASAGENPTGHEHRAARRRPYERRVRPEGALRGRHPEAPVRQDGVGRRDRGPDRR